MAININQGFQNLSPNPLQANERKFSGGEYVDWASIDEVKSSVDASFRANKYFRIAGELYQTTDADTFEQISGDKWQTTDEFFDM